MIELMLYLQGHLPERDRILALPFNHACFPPILHGFSTHSSLCYFAFSSPLLKFYPSSDHECQCNLGLGAKKLEQK